MKKNILVTGGAGFIGSNLVEALLKDERVGMVRVLDNLSTGFIKNIEQFFSNPNFEFLEGDICNYQTCIEACKTIDVIAHQAALGSVPRSIQDPLKTNMVNINGTLNIFQAAVQSKIKRVVFAASSSTYGDSVELPKVEDKIGRPLSPYAVTKYVNELYADVFARTYGLEYIGLRYFNIFGPKQDPNGAYAAVVPLFFKAALEGRGPTINGDGTNSRDFTYVENAVEANILSIFIAIDQVSGSTDIQSPINQIYNIACGDQTDLNQLWGYIKELSACTADSLHGPNRKGDIPHSLADITKANKLLQYNGSVTIKEGLSKTISFYKQTED